MLYILFFFYLHKAGQERFRTITQSYYRSANGVLLGTYTPLTIMLLCNYFILSYFILTMYLVYDITKRSSFLSLQKWIEEIRRFTATNISWILIGIFTFQLLVIIMTYL